MAPSHEIARQRPLAYVKAVHLNGDGSLGGHRLEMDQVEEGFSMAISPLLSRDGHTVDAVIRLETSQVERLTNVAIPVPRPGQPRDTTQIQVPQTSRWRLHERFRWPTTDVLLISCGVVAIAEGEAATSLSLPLLGQQPPRADALAVRGSQGSRHGSLRFTGPGATDRWLELPWTILVEPRLGERWTLFCILLSPMSPE